MKHMILQWYFAVFSLVAIIAGPALAERRVALVIGNGAYAASGRLTNPGNDATDIAAKLKTIGFEVDLRKDLTRSQMTQALRDFRARLDGADVALFYYAGHAMQVRDRNLARDHNLLLPVDADPQDELDLEAQTIRLQAFLAEMESRPRINLVFLDACRNNPLAERLARSFRAGGRGQVSIGQGLASLKTETADTLIMFATEPGETADDGKGRNSPFTAAMLKHVAMKEEISVMLKGVIADVRTATGGKQRPQQLASMASKFYLAGQPSPAGVDQAVLQSEREARKRLEEQQALTNARIRQLEQQLAANAALQYRNSQRGAEAEQAWAKMKGTATIEEMRVFVERFGDTPAGEAARDRMLDLKREAQQAEQARDAAARATAERQRLALLEQERQRASEDEVARKAAALRRTQEQTVLRDLQSELKRVGCYSGEADGIWGKGSTDALSRFIKSAGVKSLDGSVTVEMLDSVRSRQGRVCPLVCDDDERVVDGKCVARPKEPVAAVAKPPEPKAARVAPPAAVKQPANDGYEKCPNWIPNGTTCRHRSGKICTMVYSTLSCR